MVKGIFKNTEVDNTPKGYAFHAKNAISNSKLDAYINEKGTTLLTAILIDQGFTPSFINGVIVCEPFIIIFFKESTTNEDVILSYKEDYNVVGSIMRRTDFEFIASAPISGVAKINPNGQLIVVFSSDNISTKYINLDNFQNTDPLELYSLNLSTPYGKILKTQILNTGALSGGTYFVSYRYVNSEKSTTNFSPFIGPFHINSDDDPVKTGGATNKSIKIDLEVNTSYAQLEVIVASSIQGIITVKTLGYVNILNSNTSLNISGNRVGEITITLAEVIINNVSYNRIKSFAVVDNRLYGAKVETNNTTEFDDLFQNLMYTDMNLFWSSLFVDNRLTDFDGIKDITSKRCKRGELKTFIHDEVYALYLQGEKQDGTLTKFFHFPGRAASNIDLAISQSLGGVSYTKYQLQDTCTYLNADSLDSIYGETTQELIANTFYGLLGVWENEDEVYDNNYPIAALRGQKIKHHRFPSIQFMKNNIYTTIPTSGYDYGIDMLDILGLKLRLSDNAITALQTMGIKAVRIGYAKRNLADTTVLGTSILNFSGEIGISTPENRLASTGGNWSTDFSGDSSEDIPLNKRYTRFNCFDLLQDKPNLEGTYFRHHLKLKTTNLANYSLVHNTTEDAYGIISYFARGIDDRTASFLMLTSLTGGGPAVITSTYIPTFELRETLYKYYIQENSLYSLPDGHTVDNLISEEIVFSKYKDSNPDNTIVTPPSVGFDVNTTLDSALYEEVTLSSLKKPLKNVFIGYGNQDLVFSNRLDITDINNNGNFTGKVSKTIFCGDGFMTLYSYINSTRYKKSYDPSGTTEDNIKGIRAFKAFYTIGRHNANHRHATKGDIQTYYFPLNSVVVPGFDLLLTWFFQTNFLFKPLNKFLYDKDYSLPNYLGVSDINIRTSQPINNRYPYRVVRTPKASSESSFNDQWRIFKPIDYLEITKNKGEITKITNWGEYNLLIHTKRALFKTANDTVLKANDININLSSGDLFELQPREIRPTTYGVGGTQHSFACLICDIGYIYPDADTGEIWLCDGENIDNITGGLREDFYKYLKAAEDNPFNGEGISIAYDRENYRIILSLKAGQSFTVSYDTLKKEWAGYHDFLPNYIFNTRKKVYCIKSNNIHSLNTGPRGTYFGTTYSFFLDIIVNDEPTQEKILSTVNWISRYYTSQGLDITKTIDYITIRTNKYTTGRIPLIPNLTESIHEDIYSNCKMVGDKWSFNDIWNRVKDGVLPNYGNIFNDYIPNSNDLDMNGKWAENELIRDKSFIIRLEFSNLLDHEIRLLNVSGLMRLAENN